jgi:hypothetical protein
MELKAPYSGSILGNVRLQNRQIKFEPKVRLLVALRWLQYSNCLVGCVIGVFLEKRPILHIGDDSYGARMR